jgi:hypothetical protein
VFVCLRSVHWRYGDSEWTPPSPRASSIRSSTGGSEEGGTNPYARLRSAWDLGQPVCMRSELSVLVSTDTILSSCYVYDSGQCYRKLGSEIVDWQSVAFSLFGVVPLGFLLFDLDEKETWNVSARAQAQIVGVRSALCYARQTAGVLPIAVRLGKNGDLEMANVFLTGNCAASSWQRHRNLARVSNKLTTALIATFPHVSFWRRAEGSAAQFSVC